MEASVSGASWRRRLSVSLLTGSALAVASCQRPTQVTVEFTTDLGCKTWREAGVVASSFEVARRGAMEMTFRDCRVGGFVGTVVVTPERENDGAIMVRAVLGVDVGAQSCAQNGATTSCITQRRKLHYLPRTRLRLPIRFDAACRGVICTDDTTCNRAGLCVPADVVCSNDVCTLRGEDANDGNADAANDGGAATGTDAQVSVDGSIVVPLVNFAAGDSHSCATYDDGRLACWGLNGAGSVGDGTMTQRDLPTPVTLPGAVLNVTAGSEHTCALISPRRLFCWGRGDSGQLGRGGMTTALEPAEVSITQTARVVAGSYHTCALSTTGDLACWGHNQSGELGIDSTTNIDTPQPVLPPEPMKFADVSLGVAHTCALSIDGTAYCWGRNAFGQLGTSAMGSLLRPVRVSYEQAAFAQIAAGGAHTCARTKAGAVYCWGNNAAGQLGNGSMENTSVPTRVANIDDALFVAAKNVRTCAVRASGGLYCWGDNSSGELGDGTYTRRTVPTAVTDGLELIPAMGFSHTCARNIARLLFCWGRNDYGQLGTGGAEATTPQRVRGYP